LTTRLVEKEGFAALVLRLRAEGVSDIDLLTAVEQTPRSLFVPPQFAEQAYSSRTIPIECGSFLEGVDLAVRVLHQLKVKPGQRVLEIGTGSGFMTAVMARMAERVLTVDRYKTLTTQRPEAYRDAWHPQRHRPSGRRQRRLQGEGTFDRILVTAAFNAMPRFYADQLVSGGSMIAPLMISETGMPSCAPDEDRQPLRARRAFQLPLPADRSAHRVAALSAFSSLWLAISQKNRADSRRLNRLVILTRFNNPTNGCVISGSSHAFQSFAKLREVCR
jgi:protein-L-isoaspartate(D-aspartate) O-methyltransferase